MALKPLMRSQERVFILCGMADEPTWPGLEALGDELLAGHEADGLGQARRAGGDLHEGRHHVEVERAGVHLADVVERWRSKPRCAATAASSWSTASGEPSRSSMSCCVPTGPLMPRSG